MIRTTSGSPRRAARLTLVALAGVLAAAAAAVAFVLVSGGEEKTLESLSGHPRRCRALQFDYARDCYTQELLAMVSSRDDPRPVVQTIANAAWSERGYLLSNCHGIMHTVGRTYAREHGITLATLVDVLPKSNDPGCPAGFAHGLVTGVAPLIDPRQPRDAASVCSSAGTRYQRYSCVHGIGHAFMRIYGDRLAPALGLCRALDPRAGPDCAQGAYHDYWFAVVGADDASLSGAAVTDPRRLCATQPAEFVRQCWYRAFLDTRPAGFELSSASDLDALCEDLDGLQREACITAASVIGPPDPAVQLELCAGLDAASDEVNCVRGTKVQNLLRYRTPAYIDLISRCELFAGATRGACYRWLGKTIAVVTDGRFATSGCPQLRSAAARDQCLAGARSFDDALVTFS